VSAITWIGGGLIERNDGAAALAEDPEGAMLDSISQWVVPTALWLCHPIHEPPT
jgi:hypothetical protein